MFVEQLHSDQDEKIEGRHVNLKNKILWEEPNLLLWFKISPFIEMRSVENSYQSNLNSLYFQIFVNLKKNTFTPRTIYF